MKFLRILPHLLSLFFPFLSATAQTTEVTISNKEFSFLNKIPSTTKSDCASQDIIDLMDDACKEWISSVDCSDVQIQADHAGFYLRKSGNSTPSITLNFNSNQLFKVTRVWLYGRDYNVKPILKVNGVEVNMETALADPGSAVKKDQNLATWKHCASTTIDNIPLKNLTIVSNSGDLEIVGFKLFFSGMEEGSDEGGDNGDDNPGVSTRVNGVQQDASATYEYFDMQGRRLKCAPVSGLYIRRCAGKAEKLIAR